MARPDLPPTLSEMLPMLRTPEVRELAWAVGAAPLMAQHKSWPFTVLDNQWFDRELALRWPWLKALDSAPQPLLEALTAAPKLLGKRFEALLAFHFEAHPDFEILRAGWVVKDVESGGTAGEFDFVLRNLRTGRIWHLEVACKFYLAARNTSSWSAFKGPNARDTLEGKMHKLVRQLALSEHPAAAAALSAARMRIDDRVLLMKGGLFHHLDDIPRARSPLHAHPNYPSGWWIRRREWSHLLDRSGNAAIVALPKTAWMGGPGGTVLASPPERPTFCARMLMLTEDPRDWIELDRGFVVPDVWPD